MTAISTHVLDTSAGRPAAGITVALEARDGEGWRELGRAITDADGRARDLAGAVGATPGIHRLVFGTAAHLGPGAFFPEVSVTFAVAGEDHLHVPLLLSPFGYSTYRGS
jgi:5-hydroxyisourate hydrolase